MALTAGHRRRVHEAESSRLAATLRRGTAFVPGFGQRACWARFAGLRHVGVRAVGHTPLAAAAADKWRGRSRAAAASRRYRGAGVAAECRRGHGCGQGAFHRTQARVSAIGALQAVSRATPVIILGRRALCAAQTIEEAPLGTRRARLPLVFELDAIAGVRRE